MEKIICKIDLSKIDKTRVVERKYTNKEGQEITAKEYPFEVIELSNKINIKEGNGWKMVKSHFIVEGQTKEERAGKVKSKTIGEGIMFDNNKIPF